MMVSSKDVARIAGVSQSTVSRVMNNPESVKLETRLKVMEVINGLQYQPNLIARSLITNKTKTIALISGALENAFFVETTQSIVSLNTQLGYRTMVFFEENENNLLEIFNDVVGNKVDGVLISSIKLNDPLFDVIKQSNIPYMFFNRRPKQGGNYVVLDSYKAGQLIAQHLIDCGHSDIAFVTGELNISSYLERTEGFRATLKKAGIKKFSEAVYVTDTSKKQIDEVTRELMSKNSPPTAIIYASDAMALMGLDILKSMGINIPADVSVAGMDDIKMASHHSIMLTSIGHHKFRMGEIASEMLINIIERPKHYSDPIQIELPPQLVVRQTTGAQLLV